MADPAEPKADPKVANWDIGWEAYSGGRPLADPNPDFPGGVDLDIRNTALTEGAESCRGDLPYPGQGRGTLKIRCRTCGATAGATTAGRPDDPKSLIMNCRT